MRNRWVWIRFALALSTIALPGCGGSSSETPPPLEPAPERLRMEGKAHRTPSPSASDPIPAATADAPDLPDASLPEAPAHPGSSPPEE